MIFRANYCPTWHNQVWHDLSFSNISLPVLYQYYISHSKEQEQQSCGIRKSIQAKWVQQSRIKTKIEKGTPFKRSIRNQSNKHQNSQKPMLKAEQNKKLTSCMPKTAVSPNFKAHHLGLARPK